jgi:hypothetical protein
MAVTFSTDDRHPMQLSIATCETDADLIELREQHEEWHEGALSILRYPTAPVMGFLSHDYPKGLSAMAFRAPIHIGKDEAGNFSFIDLT